MDGGIAKLHSYVMGTGHEGVVDGGIPYVYIEHGDTKILLDTGVDPDNFMHGMYQSKNPPPDIKLEVIQSSEQKLMYYLDSLGVTPEDIDYLIPSHLHDDHVGHNRMFTNATCIVQREELRHAYVPEIFECAYDKTAIDVRGLKYRCIDGDHELFPDIEILATPGHSAGSQCIAVHLEKAGTILFVGDAVYSVDMYENDLVPQIWWSPSMTQWARSVQRIKAYQRKTGARLFVYHDRGDFVSNWKRFPDFYE
jgi:N-acyl homoserine lactone hydrolase